ncbi:Ig-like domain-containing protein, partial [bacterium]|nr:Ig-like domain-containing protein [bacterium]
MRLRPCISAFALIVFLAGCAKQAPPPGGLEDKTGPVILNHYPAAGAVNVNPRMVVELEFSEFVNRSSVESALFLSPDPVLRLKYKWSGRTLKLIYLDPLEQDRTYVVSVGSEARDLRGNPAGSTTTIAFATGDKLDEGKFHGWISGAEKPQAISIWAYLLEQDSIPDPLTDIAEYRIQAKTDGTFRLEYLKLGDYRVFAVDDRNRDGLWNPVSEMIGTAPWDVTVADFTDAWVSFAPLIQDTSAIVIRRVKQVNSRRFDVKLSRLVRSCSCTFTDSTNSMIESLESYSQEEEPEIWTVFTVSELHSGSWFAHCGGMDDMHRAWEAADTFDVTEKPDTLAPSLTAGWPSDYPKPAIAPDSVVLLFDEPVDYLAIPDTTLQITSSLDTIAVQVRPLSPRSILFSPSASIASGGRYLLAFNGQSISDLAGNTLSDSTEFYSFAVLAQDSLGSVLGSLSSPVGGQYLLTLRSLATGNAFDSVSVAVGPYRFDHIPSGKYLISIVQDRNRDGNLSAGSVITFEFSEPFFQSADTISVRARRS